MVLVQHSVGSMELLHIGVVSIKVGRQGGRRGGSEIGHVGVLVVLATLRTNIKIRGTQQTGSGYISKCNFPRK